MSGIRFTPTDAALLEASPAYELLAELAKYEANECCAHALACFEHAGEVPEVSGCRRCTFLRGWALRRIADEKLHATMASKHRESQDGEPKTWSGWFAFSFESAVNQGKTAHRDFGETTLRHAIDWLVGRELVGKDSLWARSIREIGVDLVFEVHDDSGPIVKKLERVRRPDLAEALKRRRKQHRTRVAAADRTRELSPVLKRMRARAAAKKRR